MLYGIQRYSRITSGIKASRSYLKSYPSRWNRFSGLSFCSSIARYEASSSSSTSAGTLPRSWNVVHSQESTTLSDGQRRTIYALSTPPGKAGVAVIRISGPDALQVRERMVHAEGRQRMRTSARPWKMERCAVVNPNTGETLDDGLAVFFKGIPFLLLQVNVC
jgi:hypothetical protein